MKRVLLALVVCVASYLFVGYDAVSASGMTPEQTLSERVMQRWAALIGQDFNRAYEFETPGFRQANPIGMYRSFYGNAVKWENSKVTTVDLSSDSQSAKVTVLLDYQGPNAAGGVYQGRRPVMETWLWTDENWWYVRNKTGLK